MSQLQSKRPIFCIYNVVHNLYNNLKSKKNKNLLYVYVYHLDFIDYLSRN